MTKRLLILSLLTLLGAAGLAVVNRSDFVSTRTEKDSINKEIKGIQKDFDTNFENQFLDVDEAIKTNEKALVEAKSLFDLTSSNLVTVTKEVELEKAKEVPLDAQIAEVERLMNEFNDRFPGIDFAALPAKIEEMETQERELKAEEEALRAENAIVSRKIETNTGAISRHQARQMERAKGLARNASQWVVTAVNNEWGFVTVNGGKLGGVTNDSRLLVSRGGQAICRLNIVSIENRLTVANIDRSTLARGAVVLPGDQVIYQNLQE